MRDGNLLPDGLKDAEPLRRIALFVAGQILAAPDDFIHADRKAADDQGIRPEAPDGVDAAFGEAVEAPGAAAKLGRVDVEGIPRVDAHDARSGRGVRRKHILP